MCAFRYLPGHNHDQGMPELSPSDERMIRLHCDWFDRSGATPVSLGHRRENLIRIAKALPCDLVDATPAVLDGWQSRLRRATSTRGRPYAANTLGSYTSHARAFYRWAAEAGHTDSDIAARLPRIRRPSAQAHPIPEKDLRIALAVANEPMRTWLLLAAFMGMRAMEIAQQTRESVIEFEDRLVMTGIGKASKPFKLTVPRAIDADVRRCLPREGPMWFTPTGRVLTAKYLSELVSDFFREQSMPYTLHWARHSFGSSMYALTKDLLLTQDAMRHSNPNTTRIYVQTQTAQAIAAMDQIAQRVTSRRSARGKGSAADHAA